MKKQLLSAFICIAFSFLFLGSLLTRNVSLYTTDGNKTDGKLEMSVEVSAGTGISINWEEARAKAKRKCQSWGYCEAEWFEQRLSECIESDADGCTRYRFTYNVQCVECDEINSSKSDTLTD